MVKPNFLKFDTLSLHAGQQPDPATGARAQPIYQSTSFVFDDTDHAAALYNLERPGHIYTRLSNPTTAALEERVAALEDGVAAVATASGMAALFLGIVTLMDQGAHIVSSGSLYGGSHNLFTYTMPRFGITTNFVDPRDPDAFRKAIRPETRLLYGETLGNPGIEVMDIPAIAEIAHEHGLPLMIDSTFTTPYLMQPFELGADLIMHSLTKFMGGHGNSMGGVIVDGGTFDWSADDRYPMLSQPRPEYNGIVLHETFGNFAFAIACRVLGLRDLGPAISPFNAFMILTGIETLPLRMQRHCDNALKVAEHLKGHDKVAWVSYAGLPDDPGHQRMQAYCPKGAGAVFTFGLKGGYDAGVKFVEALDLFSHLANIGDTRSLVIHPASTTHRQLSDEAKTRAGAGPDVVRLSVGIENAEDIIADLDRALNA